MAGEGQNGWLVWPGNESKMGSWETNPAGTTTLRLEPGLRQQERRPGGYKVWRLVARTCCSSSSSSDSPFFLPLLGQCLLMTLPAPACACVFLDAATTDQNHTSQQCKPKGEVVLTARGAVQARWPQGARTSPLLVMALCGLHPPPGGVWPSMAFSNLPPHSELSQF